MAITISRYWQFLIGILGGVALMFILWRPSPDPMQPERPSSGGAVPTPKLQALADELLPDEKNTISVFQQSAPSVVFITNKALRQDFFSMDVTEIPVGSGSGFIWDNKGHVVTNYHVIANSDSLSVTLSDQSTL